MNLHQWLNVAIGGLAFVTGAVLVRRFGKRPSRPVSRHTPPAAVHPTAQLPVRSFARMVDDSQTHALVQSIERRSRLTPGNWLRDGAPLLQAFAEFVQFLPASECHHHAQPGGLWVHALEVVDAALTFRAGMELPPGASTEDRKRHEHRWTFAVLVAALLHDVGKPVTDLLVTLYGDDPRIGRPWAPRAGSMGHADATWYSVAFGEPSARDYKAHAKLASLLLGQFVAPHVVRWLGEDKSLLDGLVAYLTGEDPDGTLGQIVKRADSDSVRRNLLQGPRTRFASARTVPLVDRLMQALKRMLAEGGQLPLNRPGAAAWIHNGAAWFVCARLADEVRAYLAANESAQGVPGKDRNDRLFDAWQEYGIATAAPDGGAVWRVMVQCDGWSPPSPLTVLRFPVEALWPLDRLPPNMRGSVTPVATDSGAAAPAATAPVPTPIAVPACPADSTNSMPQAQPLLATATTSEPPRLPPAAALAQRPQVVEALPQPSVEAVHQGPVPQALAASPAVSAPLPGTASSGSPAPASVLPAIDAQHQDDDVLAPEDSATRVEHVPTSSAPTSLGQPLRPKERSRLAPQSSHAAQPVRAVLRGPSPAAEAFLAWVAHSIGDGTLRYNEEAALVHFCNEGCLLLSPEIFRRFLASQNGPDGPVAQLRATHGDRAYARLQNELAKSGWTVRNGDENLHYYAFVKADGSVSRPAAFYLLREPSRLWNPVPATNERIRAIERALPARPPTRPPGAPRKLELPANAETSGSLHRRDHA